MMLAEVLETITVRHGALSPGQFVEIPDEVAQRLGGKIRAVTKTLDLSVMVGEALAEVDRLGRPWPRNFLDRMCQADRDRKGAIERRIDIAVLADDEIGLKVLLAEWQVFLLDRRKQHLESA